MWSVTMPKDEEASFVTDKQLKAFIEKCREDFKNPKPNPPLVVSPAMYEYLKSKGLIRGKG